MGRATDFDIVVFGATGFTGRLVAEHLANRYGASGGPSWAMAGRSAAKLAEVRDAIGAPADTALIVADVDDEGSLRTMANRARAVVTTVGPYQLYGSALVSACASVGADYLDLCGEPAWMRRMIDAHQETARNSGARILFSSGFDSIPFELGVYWLQQKAQARFGSALPRVKSRVRKMRGGFSGGTLASLKATLAAAAADPSILDLLRDPFALTPGFTGPDQPRGDKPAHDPDLDAWTAPFIMAPINTRNVHRSNFLQGHAYGADFTYDEMIVTGPGEKGQAAAEALVKAERAMGAGGGPQPGEGPSREERESGFYDVLLLGKGDDGQALRLGVTGDRDPGYGSTSKMIAETAICLLESGHDTAGGIWTPGAALGGALVERLEQHAGLSFTVED